MKHKIFAFTIFFPIFIGCSDDSTTNVNSQTSSNKVCVEEAVTVLNGISYICKDDQLIPQDTQICIESATMQDPSGNSFICKNNKWLLDTQVQNKNFSSSTQFYISSSSIPAEKVKSSSSQKNISSSISQPKSSSSSLNIKITEGSFTDERDGKKYKTVTIGTQTWMAENLNYDDSLSTSNLLKKSFCYEYKQENCSKYGRLYQWTAAMDIDAGYDTKDASSVTSNCHTGICPTSWHIPSDDEWKTLAVYLGGTLSTFGISYETIGNSLKSTDGWWYYFDEKYYYGTNTTKFNALPAGIKSLSTDNDGFAEKDAEASFWASNSIFTTSGKNGASSWGLNYKDELNFSKETYKWVALSIRCIKD